VRYDPLTTYQLALRNTHTAVCIRIHASVNGGTFYSMGADEIAGSFTRSIAASAAAPDFEAYSPFVYVHRAQNLARLAVHSLASCKSYLIILCVNNLSIFVRSP
jgi:hypothetical protein